MLTTENTTEISLDIIPTLRACKVKKNVWHQLGKFLRSGAMTDNQKSQKIVQTLALKSGDKRKFRELFEATEADWLKLVNGAGKPYLLEIKDLPGFLESVGQIEQEFSKEAAKKLATIGADTELGQAVQEVLAHLSAEKRERVTQAINAAIKTVTATTI